MLLYPAASNLVMESEGKMQLRLEARRPGRQCEMVTILGTVHVCALKSLCGSARRAVPFVYACTLSVDCFNTGHTTGIRREQVQ